MRTTVFERRHVHITFTSPESSRFLLHKYIYSNKVSIWIHVHIYIYTHKYMNSDAEHIKVHMDTFYIQCLYTHMCVYIYTQFIWYVEYIYICIIGNHHMPADCIHSPHLRPSSHPAGWKAAARRGNTSLSWAFEKGDAAGITSLLGEDIPWPCLITEGCALHNRWKKQPESVWSCVENHGRPEKSILRWKILYECLNFDHPK